MHETFHIDHLRHVANNNFLQKTPPKLLSESGLYFELQVFKNLGDTDRETSHQSIYLTPLKWRDVRRNYQ
jgi:hypothetical protein